MERELPTPVDVKPRVHALAIADLDATSSLDSALAVAPRFGLAAAAARAIAGEVGRSVARWRSVAARQGLAPRAIERMESAFEHDDLRAARGLSP
jgi:serine/threonine-protein kinase HipA